jgi:zinc D-Ala-D-Ala carboxypeptidase
MRLTEHFTLEELTASQVATRRRIDNTPAPRVIDNLNRVAAVLEAVRALIKRPIVVSSGYRSPALNVAVGGAAKSAHVQGLAADINAVGMSAHDLAQAIAGSDIMFDQLIFEGTWVHIGLCDGVPRRQVSTAHFGSTGTTYVAGIAP